MRGGESSGTTRARRVADELEDLALKALRRQERFAERICAEVAAITSRNAFRARNRHLFFETRPQTGKETMHAGKPEIAAKTAVCDGALGSISGVVDKIREKGSYLTAPTKRLAAKMLCRRKRHGDAFLTKHNGRSHFLSFGERKVGAFFQSESSRSNVIGCVAACSMAYARIMRVTANGVRRGRRKTARNMCILLEKRVQERKGVPCLRNCARVREGAKDLCKRVSPPGNICAYRANAA